MAKKDLAKEEDKIIAQKEKLQRDREKALAILNRVRAGDKALLEMSRALSYATWNGVEQSIDQVDNARARELFGRIRRDFLDPLMIRQQEILRGVSSTGSLPSHDAAMRDYFSKLPNYDNKRIIILQLVCLNYWTSF